MSTNRRSLTSVNPLVETRDVIAMKAKTGNLYESIAVISRRANQISVTMKEELHRKLDEFTVHGDNLEEVHENKEQIEISRIYERMANPALQAVTEFFDFLFVLLIADFFYVIICLGVVFLRIVQVFRMRIIIFHFPVSADGICVTLFLLTRYTFFCKPIHRPNNHVLIKIGGR